MKEYLFKSLYVQSIENKVTKICCPLNNKYTNYLKDKDFLNKFIIQLNYLLSNDKLTQEGLDEILETKFDCVNSTIAGYNLAPKQIEFEEASPPNAPGYLINVSYDLFVDKLNFDFEAVKKAVAEEINSYIVWRSRFSLGITKHFQLYTEWYPSVCITFSFPDNKLYFNYGEFRGHKKFECILDLVDSKTETLIAAVKEANNLRVQKINCKENINNG